jgi:hypothetical protein
LERLGVSLDLPFRDFKSFNRHWIAQGMSGSWEARRITDVTRRRLRDGLARTWWAGALNEVEFLHRLYDLNKLPSHDPRPQFATAARDIWQHCINNPADWDEDWVWYDQRFGLADGDEALLRFLAEMLHPAVRTDPAEVERLRIFLNETLAHDGY